jgi:hypothetical protein
MTGRAAWLAAAGLAAAGAAAAAAAWPPNQGAAHAPPGPEHSHYLRRVGSGEHVPPRDNPGERRAGGRASRKLPPTPRPPLPRPRGAPGVRVYPGVVGGAEAAALLRELGPIKAAHGINLIPPGLAALYRFQVGGGGAGWGERGARGGGSVPPPGGVGADAVPLPGGVRGHGPCMRVRL